MAEESENSELVRLGEQHAKIADNFASMKPMMTEMCRNFTAAQTTPIPVGIEGFVPNAHPHGQGKSIVEGGNPEFDAHERLIELNKRLTVEVQNLKQLVIEQNERSIEEVKNLKQFVVELYHAITVGHASPPMPSNFSRIAPTIVHQAPGLPTTIEDPQYSPGSPHYYNASKVAGSSTMCPLAPPSPPKRWCASPEVSVPPFTSLFRTENLGKKEERERGLGRRDEEWCKQPHSCPRASQKLHLQHCSLQNSQYSIPPPQCSVHTAPPYAPAPSYPQWRAPAPQSICPTQHAPHNQLQPPLNLPHRPKGPPGFHLRAEYRRVHQEKKNKFTVIGESYTKLFEKLQQANLLNPILGKMHPTGKVDHSRRCAFHSGAPGHDTEQCWELKRAIQAMIDNNRISVMGDETQNVNQNPLPVHDA